MHNRMGKSLGLTQRVRSIGVLAASALVLACSTETAPSEKVDSLGQPLGAYDLVASYNDPGGPRGWIVEWRIPELLNGETAVGAIGQWYNSFESGVYYTGGRWHVYYFGDDNGIAGNNPDCDATWGIGGFCHGVFADLQPGQEVAFKYEFCTPERVPSVTGTQNCLYVDMKDGAGWRFMAEDTNVREYGPEMYTHDVEQFWPSGNTMPQISCAAPTKMLRQAIQTPAGTWVELSGEDTWSFRTTSPYKYQNVNLSETPASWESCSQLTALIDVTRRWESGYCANLVVSNNGPSALSSWWAQLELNDAVMTNTWGANFAPQGSRSPVTPSFWNATLPAGSTTSVGFCANSSFPSSTPVVIAHGSN